MDKVYYLDQSDWRSEDFFYLNRYLSKMFLHHHRRIDEIRALDITRMTNETKVLICAIVKFQRKENFLKSVGLGELLDCEPLKEKLYLVDNPVDCHKEYVYYNIGL